MTNNKQLMYRFTDFINTASKELAEELIAPEAVFYVPMQEEPMRGPDGYLSIIHMMRSGFSDIQWTVKELVAEGDLVATRFVMKGTQDGVFFGFPPTSKKIEVNAMNFYRFSNGQIIEEYGQPDMLGLLQQLGAIPKA
ncbi:ester cyclase [Paenibacillus donghaensis]|uniref:Ester cyclase n=1 Tax=Paenibacillus donghaensis TaxID=414771 RepID=A0A2Z2K5H3_9BACL|nr:ester cyclase [Paenibacillus donghaensis]ASA19784.1 ester cyclase [Paenibacillus donghaensis]